MVDHSLCVFTTLRASLEDTLAFAFYHLNIGVNHMFLFFDDPQDQAIAALARERRVTCIRCDAAHWAALTGNLPETNLGTNAKLEINSRVAINMARAGAYDWIGHIDSDELIYAPDGLKRTIAAIPPRVQIAKFPILEAIPEQLSVQSPFLELRHFKHAPVRFPRNKAVFLDPHQIVRFGVDDILFGMKSLGAKLLGFKEETARFIKGPVLGKSIARTGIPMASFRSHFPIPTDRERLQISLFPAIKILHYDAADYERWKTKWTIRYVQTQKGLIPIKPHRYRQQQYDAFAKLYERGDEAELVALFRSTYSVSPADLAILQKVGLVSEVDLPESMFTSHEGKLDA